MALRAARRQSQALRRQVVLRYRHHYFVAVSAARAILSFHSAHWRLLPPGRLQEEWLPVPCQLVAATCCRLPNSMAAPVEAEPLHLSAALPECLLQ